MAAGLLTSVKKVQSQPIVSLSLGAAVARASTPAQGTAWADLVAE
jgi:hypothetical protein